MEYVCGWSGCDDPGDSYVVSICWAGHFLERVLCREHRESMRTEVWSFDSRTCTKCYERLALIDWCPVREVVNLAAVNPERKYA